MSTAIGEIAWLTITLLILLLVSVILVVLVGLRRQRTRQQIDSLRNMIHNIRYPWQKEDRSAQRSAAQEKGSAVPDHQKKPFGRGGATEHPVQPSPPQNSS